VLVILSFTCSAPALPGTGLKSSTSSAFTWAMPSLLGFCGSALRLALFLPDPDERAPHVTTMLPLRAGGHSNVRKLRQPRMSIIF